MLRVFEAFCGYGSQSLALTRYGVQYKSVGVSEVNIAAQAVYYSVQAKKSIEEVEYEHKTVGEKVAELEYKNIGYDFTRRKSAWTTIIKKVKENRRLTELQRQKVESVYSQMQAINNYGDISKINPKDLPDMDLFTYSFPCQDISTAGKQKGLEKKSGTRSSLLWDCTKIIKEKKPKYLMLENVRNLLGSKHKKSFETWLEVLDELGYISYYKIINAKFCGVPQNRPRVFCVSIRKDIDTQEFCFEEDFDSGVRLKDILELEVDEKYYLASDQVEALLTQLREQEEEKRALKALKSNGNTVQKLANEQGNHYGGGLYSKEGISPSLVSSEGGGGANNIPKITTNCIKIVGNISPTNYGAMNVHDPQGVCKTLVANGGGNTEPKVIIDDTLGYNGVRLYDKYSPTLRSERQGLKTVQRKDKKIRIRKLTPKECFRLMGLTDEEIAKIQATKINNRPISNSQQYKLAGNSIVVPSMRFLKNLVSANKEKV